MANVCIITVNYNTPDLIERLIRSYYDYEYNNVPIYFVDGSTRDFQSACKDIYDTYNINHVFADYNIHHGPGLHYLITELPYDEYLLLDSDAYFIKSGMLSEMYNVLTGDCLGVGDIQYVDNDGENVSKSVGIPYLHPRCALIRKDVYLKYNPLTLHGAPFIETMLGRPNLVPFNTKIYVREEGRGTLNRFGLQIN